MTAVHAAHDGGKHRVDEGIGKGRCVCVCEREQGGSAEPSKECVRKVNVFAFWHGSLQKKGGKVFAFVSAGADTKANTLGAAAHLRLVIFVSLRMAASAVAPWAPIRLALRLQARGRMGDGESRE